MSIKFGVGAILVCTMVFPSGIGIAREVPKNSLQATSEVLVAGLIVGNSQTLSASSLGAVTSGLPSVADAGLTVTSTRQITGATVVNFDGPIPADEAQLVADDLLAKSFVDWVDLDIVMKPTATPQIPNDPEFKNQWHLWDPTAASNASVDAPLGWNVTTGQSSVVVAVLDSGWTEHPDLDERQINGYDFVSDSRQGNDGDGRDPDARDPGDWVSQSDTQGYFRGCRVSDSSWHGTHVAGIIAAERNNRRGISGIAPDVRVMAVRVMGKCGGRLSDVVEGLRWAAGGSVSGVPKNTRKVQVINMSLGATGRCSSSMRSAVDFARSQGVTVVVAAGNEDAPVSSSTPANCPGVISVAASNPSGKITSWSNYGTSTQSPTIIAPGESILSTYNAGRQRPGNAIYQRTSGTSMAAPVVAGAVALLYSLGVEPTKIESSLRRLIKPFPARGSGTTCTPRLCGAGLLSLNNLSEFGRNPVDPPPTPPTPDPGPDPDPGPVPLTAPGLVENVSVRYARAGRTSKATISWSLTRGGSRVIYYLYRVQLAGKGWTKWQQRVPAKITVNQVPRGDMSFVEIRGVNEMGSGPVYQVAVYPK